MIYVRSNGTPYVKPVPEDYPDAASYMRAFHTYRDEITEDANRAFDAAFRTALRKGGRR